MATVSQPIFVQASALGYNLFSTANTARDGTGTLSTLSTGDADGSLITKLNFKATGTTTAGMIRVFLSLDNGTTNRLIGEVSVSAITPSATVQSFEGSWTPPSDLVLPDANALLRVSTHNSEEFVGIALGGKY